MPEEFIKVCKLSELENKRGISFSLVNDTDIAVFRVNDKVYAIENTCPHNHSHSMHEGLIDKDLYVSCPIHGYQFHLETGKVPPDFTEVTSKLETYSTKIVDGEVFIEKKKKKFKFFDW
jgi:NAD(P)H-dependent nitrite reductase small subunit